MVHAPKATVTPADEPPAARERSRVQKRTPELDAALGARIRATRIAAQMSQAALGDAIGISFQQIQKYESGRDRIAATTLQGLAAALGVHPGSFFDDDMPMPSRPILEVKRSLKAAEVLAQISDPRVLKRLLALAEVLAGSDDGPVEKAAAATDETR